MINISINLNNVRSDIDLQKVAQDLSITISQLTGQNPNIAINMRDDLSTSPVGIHLTDEFQRLRKI